MEGIAMGKHDGGDSTKDSGKHQGKHQATKGGARDDAANPGSFWVDSPERTERGTGNEQTGGRDD